MVYLSLATGMLHNYINLLFALVFGVYQLFAQSDSLKMAQLFDSALYQPQKKDFYFKKIDSLNLLNRKDSDMGAIFYLLRARYELKCGNLETAQKMIEDGQKNFPSNKNIQPYFFSLKGSVFALQKEFEKAIYNYKNALEIYESRNKKREAAYIKNNIANTFFNLNDFESAYIYAKESFEEAYQLNDTIYFPQFAAILSISEAKTNKLKEAREHAKLAIDQGNKYRTPVAVIVGKYALGDVYSQQNEWSQAKEFYNEVVGLSEQMKLYQYEVYGRIGLLSCNVKLNLFNEAVVQGEKVIKLNEMLNTHYTDYTVYQQLSELTQPLVIMRLLIRTSQKQIRCTENIVALKIKKLFKNYL